MKERKAEGMGVVNHTENLTVDEETETWEKGVINKFTLKGLSYGVFFYNYKVFGLRWLSEHKQLKTEKFVVNTTNAGESKITFSEFGSKTVKILCSRCEQCIKISWIAHLTVWAEQKKWGCFLSVVEHTVYQFFPRASIIRYIRESIKIVKNSIALIWHNLAVE